MFGIIKRKKPVDLLDTEWQMLSLYNTPGERFKNLFKESRAFRTGYQSGVLASVELLRKVIENKPEGHK